MTDDGDDIDGGKLNYRRKELHNDRNRAKINQVVLDNDKMVRHDGNRPNNTYVTLDTMMLSITKYKSNISSIYSRIRKRKLLNMYYSRRSI
jgi:hypothetical protein